MDTRAHPPVEAIEDKTKNVSALEQAKGIFAVVLGGLIFSAAASMVHFSQRISAIQHLVYRSAFGTVLMGSLLALQGRPLLGFGKAKPWIIFRGLVTAPSLILYFLALRLLPPANAVTIYSGTGGFTLVINHIFLGEPLGLIHIPCVALSVIGAALVAQPSFLRIGDIDARSRERDWYYLVAIAGAMLMSLQSLPTRVACRYGSFNQEMLFALSAIGLVLSLGIVLVFDFEWVWPPYSISELVSIAAISIGGLVIQATSNYALERLEGGVVGLITPCEVVWAFVWQIFVFHHPTNLAAVSGACVVISSILLISLDKLLDLRCDKHKVPSIVNSFSTLVNDGDSKVSNGPKQTGFYNSFSLSSTSHSNSEASTH